MYLELLPYTSYERSLPQEGNYILGQLHNHGDHIIVYQAFNDRIADYAVANQKFGGPDYSFSRMTWIKPNFLWMMYRSGWAQKENQNRILAIEITLNSFLWLLKFGVLSSYHPEHGTHEEWKKELETSDVRIQWDPDHGIHGEKLKRRAVQIGISGEALRRFHELIESITDISSFVNEQYSILQSKPEALQVVQETVIDVGEGLRKKYQIPEWNSNV